MENRKFDPNKINLPSFRSSIAILILGGISVAGCANVNNTSSSTTNTDPTQPTELKVNNDCIVSGTGGGLMSNSKKSVSKFAENYIEDLNKIEQTDLSDCVDEVISNMVNNPNNIDIGASSPDSMTNTVFVPGEVKHK